MTILFQRISNRASISIALLLIVVSAPLSAQNEGLTPAQIEEAQTAISELRSPYCPGFMLEVCPSPQAEALRDSLYQFAATGMTSDELVEWMVASHGEEWRGLPRRSGAGLFAWILPPVVLVLGILGFLLWLRSNRNPAGPDLEADGPQISDEEREKLALALQDWEQERSAEE